MKPLAFALVATLLTSAPALAGPATLKQLSLAQDLFAYGLETQDPVIVLGAAKIAASVHVTDVDRPVETRAGDTPGNDTGEGELPQVISAKDMFAVALDLAAGDETLVMLIEDAEAEGSRGRVGGASRTLNRLQSGYVDMVKVQFKGGELAELAILGTEGASLDLKVSDDKGHTICAEQGASDKLYCAWTPATDGAFFAEIENTGAKRNSYYVLTN
ncbi:hypothetical protein [Thalassovita sp.]|uniref:hypothetical protein n=1 Tax=Thalassovita sp. TaxID=1979401 RepID=UPI0029DE7660|nr:hypothetical protein [Thalassovita sp.]